MEANVKTPVFATMFFAVAILLVGFMINVMMIPSDAELTDDVFWLYSVPTLVIMCGVVIDAVYESERARKCGVVALLLSLIMMILGSSCIVFVVAGLTIIWARIFFRSNPICHKQMKKWIKEFISEEKPA